MKNKIKKISSQKKRSAIDLVTENNLNFSEISVIKKWLENEFNRLLKSEEKLSLVELKDKISKFQKDVSLYGKEAFSMPEHKTAVAVISASMLDDRAGDLEEKIKNYGKAGGLTKRKSGNVSKPNDIMTLQLNSPLLLTYYCTVKPDAVNSLTPDEITAIMNSQVFYRLSSKYAFLEDAILSMAKHETANNETFLGIDHYVYKLPIINFLQYSGAKGDSKKQFFNLLNDVFRGRETMRGNIWINEGDEIKMYNLNFISIVFQKDVMLIGIEKNLFRSIVEKGQAPGTGYINYPEHLETRLRGATEQRYSVHIRRLYDFLLRDLERKNSVSKPAALIMASIEYTSAFRDLTSFSIKKSQVLEFLSRAIPAINEIKISGKVIIDYGFEGQNLYFKAGY